MKYIFDIFETKSLEASLFPKLDGYFENHGMDEFVRLGPRRHQGGLRLQFEPRGPVKV